MKKSIFLPMFITLLFLAPVFLVSQVTNLKLSMITGKQPVYTPLMSNPLLYGQLSIPSNEGGISSQDFTDYPDYTCQAADDFIVPAGELWTIDEIFVSGAYTSGGGPVQVSHLFVYTNDPALNIPLIPIITYLDHPVTVTGGDITFYLTADPIALSAGHYWISVQPHMAGDLYGQWFWRKQESPDILNEYHWKNPGGGFGIPGSQNWLPGSVVQTGTDHNLTFGLYGNICAPLLSVGSISTDQTVCNGNTPAILTGIAPLNGTAPTYQWQYSNDNATFTNITGATDLNYQPGAIGETMFYRQVQNAAGTCGGPLPTNTVTITWSPVLPVNVLIMSSGNSVPAGSTVSLIAIPTNGGPTPTYQWKVNGVNVPGATAFSYSYIPLNNDVVICELYSSEPCPGEYPATSNAIIMIVQPGMSLSFNLTPDCTTGAIDVVVNNGNGGPYTYNWSNGATASGLPLAYSGTYRVTVTDPFNWSVSDSIHLTNYNCDFGDAPDADYKTYKSNNGARHIVSGLKLGMFVDVDGDGQPTLLADGDDNNGTIPDDEDGIFSTNSLPFAQLQAGTNMLSFTTYNNLNQSAYLQGWVDFDGDKLVDPNEQILTNKIIPQGPFSGHVIFEVPASFAPSSFARFRLSYQYDLPFTGLAPEGEVEDYHVDIVNNELPVLDYGDAPDDSGNPDFHTLNTNNGACHFVDCRVRLGDNTDAESNGQPTMMADGDNGDEDGVIFPAAFSATNNLITIYPHNYLLNGTVYLNGWMDFNQDGIWGNSPNEHFLINSIIPYAGTTCCNDPNYPGWLLNIPVPLPANASGCMYARFRISDTPGLGPSHPAGSQITIGEVEDYRICIACPNACENFDDGMSNFLISNDGMVSAFNLVVQSPGSGGYTGDMGLSVTDWPGSTWLFNNTDDYSGNYLACPNHCLCWDIKMLQNDLNYFPSVFLFSGFTESLPFSATNPLYMARFESSSLTGSNVWAHTCAPIQPSVGVDPPVSQAGMWSWSNFPGAIPPAWNNFISDIDGIIFRVDVTGWGGIEQFILDSICLSPCKTDTVTLTVNSFPFSNVAVSAVPADINGQGSGTTLFTRDYIEGTIMYLNAPPAVTNGTVEYCFSHWIINGMNFLTDYNNPAIIKMNTDRSYTAIYCKKNKSILVQAKITYNNGQNLPLVPITFSPSLSGGDLNGLITVPYYTGPTGPAPFTGTYNYPGCSSNPVMCQLTAPLFFGNYKFISWFIIFTDCYGNSYSFPPTGNNTIIYPLDKDYEFTAVYEDCCSAVVTDAGASCCDGSIVQTYVCGTAPFEYMWANSATTKDISGLCPGRYCVTITDINGFVQECCWEVGQSKSTCLSAYVQNQVIPNGWDTCFSAVQTIYVAGNGTSFNIQNGGSALFVAGQKISFLPGTTVQYGGNLHGYISSSGENCNSYKGLEYEFQHNGVNNSSLVSQADNGFFKTYPNPTNGGFLLELTGIAEPGEIKVELYGMHGEIVQSVVLTGKQKYDLSLSGQPAGVYFIRVVSGKNAGTGKIIKQ